MPSRHLQTPQKFRHSLVPLSPPSFSLNVFAVYSKWRQYWNGLHNRLPNAARVCRPIRSNSSPPFALSNQTTARRTSPLVHLFAASCCAVCSWTASVRGLAPTQACAPLLSHYRYPLTHFEGKWPSTYFDAILSSSPGQSAFSTALCIMQYFVSVHSSLSASQPLSSDASFVVLHRCALAPSSSLRRADAWTKMQTPLCPITISRGSLDPKICDGHVVVDFANKVIGGGVLEGGNVQEEIIFSKHPEAIVSCLLCEQMYKTESIMIYGARCFSETEGYGGSFAFVRAAHPPAPSATLTVLGYSVAASAGDLPIKCTACVLCRCCRLNSLRLRFVAFKNVTNCSAGY